MDKVSVNQLADAITQAIREYTDDVIESIGRATDETSDKILREVKSLAPGKGRYRAGFAKNNQSTPNNRRYVVWNKKFYRLVHLLEKGHATRDGGETRKFPHMGPAEQKHIPAYEEKVKRIIRNGG
jgi:Mg2+ and Co2+ transporter CorA